MKKILALLLVAMMVISLAACNNNETPDNSQSESQSESSQVEEPEAVVAELKSLKNKEYGVDYVSLYSKFGKEASIADVEEDPETGFAYIEKDGVKYELGLDFLSMAMVYNTDPAGSDYANADEVYVAWWKLYMQRWNALLPEVPLYSNEYYDLYNAKIKGVEEHQTNPYWTPALALIDWTSEKEDNSIIIGNTTDLSGKFRYAAFGASNPGAADNDIQKLTEGLETVATYTKDGSYIWNPTVVVEHSETENDDGSKTFTVKIAEDLVFSDGSPITAKNYVARAMAFSTPVAAQAAGKDHMALMQYVGYKAFSLYDGTNDGAEVDGVTVSKVMSGIRLIDDYTFAVTVDPEYLPYYYDIAYAGFAPTYLKVWLGDADVVDDGEGCYFTDNFYEKNGDTYVVAEQMKKSATNTDTTYPYSGAYVVKSYDNSDKSAVLELNPNFKGNYEGVKPSIEKVVYKKIVSDTQLEDLQAGGIDCISGITGGDETNEAIDMADKSEGKYVYTHYSRAGYGKLGFRADFGPAQYTEVRQAIAYCMDRAKFAKDFTGGYGGVVDGPYYSGAWMYKEAVANGMELNAYATSVDSAIAVLEEGGWVYDKDGNDYVEGVRYKKIPAAEAEENDINYQSKDGAYKTTKVGDDYYMPLAINWYGTSNNPFTDQLMTGFMENDNIKAAGFVVQNTIGEFSPMLDELYQAAVYGYYSGSPLYNAFNFATGYNSAVYDYAYNLTIDPSMYEDYSQWYIKDLADAYWLK